MTRVAVQLSGVISMAKDFGVSLTGVVKSDSSSVWEQLTEMVWEVGADVSRCCICGSKDQGWGSQVTKGTC